MLIILWQINSWSLVACCLDIECLVSGDFSTGFLGTHSENATVSGNQYSVIHSTNISSSPPGTGITAKYKTHKGGHSKWTALGQAAVSAMKKNKAGEGVRFYSGIWPPALDDLEALPHLIQTSHRSPVSTTAPVYRWAHDDWGKVRDLATPSFMTHEDWGCYVSSLCLNVLISKVEMGMPTSWVCYYM